MKVNYLSFFYPFFFPVDDIVYTFWYHLCSSKADRRDLIERNELQIASDFAAGRHPPLDLDLTFFIRVVLGLTVFLTLMQSCRQLKVLLVNMLELKIQASLQLRWYNAVYF